MANKVLITGGAGFIGSHLVEGFLNKNYVVRVIDNFSTGNINNLKQFKNDIELIEGDIRSYHTVMKAVKNIDFVLHQAALPSVPRSIYDPITTNEVNISGTLNLLWASAENRVEKFLFASSSSIYGNSEVLPKREIMHPNPMSPYAVTKLTCENYCRIYSSIYKLKTVCIRYFNVFGPRQNPFSQYSAVIPKFINAVKNSIPPTIYGDGTQSRDFTFVKNIVNANILATEKSTDDNLIMNCACNEQITLNELVVQLNKLLHKNLKPIYANERQGDIKHSFADISIAKEKIGYIPEVFFNEGLYKTINY